MKTLKLSCGAELRAYIDRAGLPCPRHVLEISDNLTGTLHVHWDADALRADLSIEFEALPKVIKFLQEIEKDQKAKPNERSRR